MTTEEISSLKVTSEEKIRRILKDLAMETGCVIAGVEITTEEGFALLPSIFVDVKIKLQIP